MKDADVRVFTVWEPILATDWSRPGSAAAGRIVDTRAKQYWDVERSLAKQMAADARSPQPKQDCCVRDGFLWDLAAVYEPGAQWSAQMPPAVFFNGAVVDVEADLAAAIRKLIRPQASASAAAAR